MEELRREIDELDIVDSRVQEQVNRAREAGQDIGEQVLQWLREAHNMKATVNTHLQVDETAKSTRKIRFFSCCRKSKKSNEDVLKMKVLVSDLVTSGKSILCVSFPEEPKGIELVWRQGFVDFESRRSAFDRIIEGLKDDEIGIIGVLGMGGIGKTKLVQEIGKEAKNEKIFSQVVIATVSQIPVVKNIQGTLADMLGLKFKEVNEAGRAFELRNKLEDPKILVILDDVWEKIDLGKIGIPSYLNVKGCKVVLTTRNEKACNDMSCELVECLDVINDDEAWDLFSRYAGLQHKPGLLKKAKKIKSECAGLPLALITVGSALRNKSLEDYEDAARRLVRSNFVNVEGVDGVDIYSCLKLSYEYLDNDEARKCFLLCSLYPEDSEILIEELTRYAYGWWLFQKVKSIDEARLIVIDSVQRLENACLLSPKNYLDPDAFIRRCCVKMHDIVRDTALWIANNEYGLFVVGSLKEFLNRKINEKAFAVSVSSRDVDIKLLDELKCGELRIFLMQIESVVLPGNFFRKASTLQVLDVHMLNQNARPGVESSTFELSLPVSVENLVDLRTLSATGESPSVESSTFELSLPVSIENLVNLRTLRVTGEISRNSDMSIVRKLSNLEVLQLDGGPKVLPIWIGELCNLRLLDISSWLDLEEIPCNLLARLTNLEELYTPIYPKKQSDFLADLRSLPRLNVFSGWVSVDKSFPGDYCIKMLKRYVMSNMDAKEFGLSKIGWSKVLGLYCKNELSIKAFEQFIPDVESFQTMGPMQGIFNLYPQVDSAGLQNVRELELMLSENLECLINTPETGHQLSSLRTVEVLPNLVQLSLLCLPQLGKLCHGPPPLSYLGKLKHARIISCPKLKNIVPHILPVGPQLEELRSEYCEALKYVYEMEDEGIQYAENYESLFPCPMVVRLTNHSVLKGIWKVPYQLEKQQGMDDDRAVKSSIKEGQERSLNAILKSLKSLVDIRIHQCDELEEIFPILEFVSWKHVGPLSNLVKLDFEGLPKLKCIFKNPHSNYCLQKLECIRLCRCDKLTSLFTCTLAMSLVKLQELQIDHCGALETIIVPDDQFGSLRDPQAISSKKSFQEIKSIRIRSCENLKSVLPISFVAPGLPKLKSIFIEDCANLEQVFDGQKKTVAESRVIELINLQSLELVDLPKLACLLPSDCHFIVSPKLHFKVAVTGQGEHWKLSRGVLPIEAPQILLGLQKLDIEGCYYCDVDQVFDVKEVEQVVLAELQEVKVAHMPSLKYLWKGPTEHISLCNLRQIKVHNCLSIKSLFPISVSRNLRHLWWLSVENCPQLEHIFDDDLSCPEPNTWSTTEEEIHSPGVFRCKPFGSIFEPLIEEDFIGPYRLPQCAIQLKELPCLFSICPPGYALSCQSFFEAREVIIESSKTKVVYDNKPIRKVLGPTHGLQILTPPLILPSIRTLCQLVNLSHLNRITVLALATLSKNFLPQQIARKLVSLKVLKVSFCDEFETLVEPAVETEPSLSALCFPQLRFLSIEGCEKLKNIFPLSIANFLPSLETVRIDEADQLEHIFFEDRNVVPYAGYNIIELPKLNTVRLLEVPLLSKICPAGYILTGSFSTWVFQEDKPLVPSVFVKNSNMEVVFDFKETTLTEDQLPFIFKLRSLCLSHLYNMACIWKGPTELIKLSSLQALALEHCRTLQMKSLFTYTIAQTLFSLEHLKVNYCKELEHIIEPATVQEYTLLSENNNLFQCFPKLTTLILQGCDKLKTVFPLSVAQYLPKLKGIWLEKACDLEEIFTEDRNEVDVVGNRLIWLPELSTLELGNLPCLSRICPVGYTFHRQTSFEYFQVKDCPLMTEQELSGILVVSSPLVEQVQNIYPTSSSSSTPEPYSP